MLGLKTQLITHAYKEGSGRSNEGMVDPTMVVKRMAIAKASILRLVHLTIELSDKGIDMSLNIPFSACCI